MRIQNWRNPVLRKIQGELTTFSFLCLQRNPAAEQRSQAAANRQAKAGSPKSAASGSIRLLESFKNQIGLIFRYTDTRIFNGQGQILFFMIKIVWKLRSLSPGNFKAYFALGRKFKGIGQQIPKNLLDPVTICIDGIWHAFLNFSLKLKVLPQRHFTKVSLYKPLQLRNADRFFIYLHFTGIHFG
ncbi:hypothetical protein D3C81_731440 [compost metagenome]